MNSGGRRFVVVLLVAACVALTWAHDRAVANGTPSPVAGIILAILSPGQKAVAAVARTARSVSDSFANSRRLAAENRRLRQSDALARSLAIQLRELQGENERLKALLGYRQEQPRATAARVVGESGSPWSCAAIIDRGSRDGVHVRDVAVTARGLVGQVSSVVSPRSALVLLLTDSSSGVGAVVERSHVVGILKGRGRDLPVLAYLKEDADVRKGDVVITSGRGGVFPKGIPIGVVQRVERDRAGSGKNAVVMPFAELDQLDEVLVLPGGQQVAERPGL